jgi:hypothetical protein
MRTCRLHGLAAVQIEALVTGAPVWSSSSATICAGPAVDPVQPGWLAGQDTVFE